MVLGWRSVLPGVIQRDVRLDDGVLSRTCRAEIIGGIEHAPIRRSDA